MSQAEFVQGLIFLLGVGIVIRQRLRRAGQQRLARLGQRHSIEGGDDARKIRAARIERLEDVQELAVPLLLLGFGGAVASYVVARIVVLTLAFLILMPAAGLLYAVSKGLKGFYD